MLSNKGAGLVQGEMSENNNKLSTAVINNNNNNNNNNIGGNQQERIGYTNSEVWFRAAIIAVPICGTVILFVLIVLALKLLRNENRNDTNHKLGGPPMYVHRISSSALHQQQQQQQQQQQHHQHHHQQQQEQLRQNGCEKFPEQLDRTYDNILRRSTNQQKNSNYYDHDCDDLLRIQVPLLLQNEFIGNNEKNETNAKLNLMHYGENYFDSDSKSIMLEIEKEVSPKCSEVNLIKPINCDNASYTDIKYINQDNIYKNNSI